MSSLDQRTTPGRNSFAVADVTAHRIKSELTWYQLVHAEIIAVTSAMRKNARWSGMNVNGLNMGGLGMSMGLRKGHGGNSELHSRNQENPLMGGFASLREYLNTVQEVEDLDALLLLNPFLEVIRSGNTTGPIAGTALGSIEKFLHYGIVGLRNPSIAFAMNALSSAATHCKFEASDAASDELVLLRMLQVLEMALTSESGQVLSDEAVCEMMETGLSMCCQMRLSEMLRRSAEHVMINMVIAIFERLKTLEDEWVYIDSPTYRHENIDANKDISKGAPHMSTPKQSSSPTTSTEKQLSSTTPNKESSNAENDFIGGNTDTVEGTTSNQKQEREDEGEGENNEIIEPAPLRPYGLPAIRELLRVLISLLNPHEHKHTDSMRLMALSILNVAFEVGGKSISRFEILRSLVADDFANICFSWRKQNPRNC